MHAVFLAEAPPETPLSLVREALDASHTRVLVRRGDGDSLLCAAVFRFGPHGGRFTYRSLRPEPGLPAPEALPSEAETAAVEGWSQYAVGPIETRRISVRAAVKPDEPAVFLGWLRPREPLPDDPRLHAAALCFLGEYRSHWAVERRLGAEFPHTQIALQDHALWIHRTEPWDDWWLVRTTSDVGEGGRCFSRREIFTRGGDLVASAAWEAFVHPRAR